MNNDLLIDNFPKSRTQHKGVDMIIKTELEKEN